MQHVFIVGSKGIPSAYGGYETFVDRLTECHQDNEQIKYHVACKNAEKEEFEYHNAHCFNIKVPGIGPAQAIYYDVAALIVCCRYIREHHIEHAIIYILACRIGYFAPYFKWRIHKLGGKVYINPDGHEWMRAKWSAPVRRYWKLSERIMIKYSDLLICDSKNIERYIHEAYDGKGVGGRNPRTTYIAYGAEARKSQLEDDDISFVNWLNQKGLQKKEYYLAVGRFVPENNYEIMIREFMGSNTKRSLAIVTTVNISLSNHLENKLHFRQDKRIKFVGTVYDKELLMKIRENAYAYIHGHEVGGTNPSLLEALGSTDLNLLLDVGFNKEVAEDTAVYWNKVKGNLAALIDTADKMNPGDFAARGERAKKRIKDLYSWKYIADKYIRTFINV
jgi:rhamnosyltransferase